MGDQTVNITLASQFFQVWRNIFSYDLIILDYGTELHKVVTLKQKLKLATKVPMAHIFIATSIQNFHCFRYCERFYAATVEVRPTTLPVSRATVSY